MASKLPDKLSDEEIAMYLAMLEKAEPYPYGAPEINTLDGEPSGRDEDRVAASFAKLILEEAGII